MTAPEDGDDAPGGAAAGAGEPPVPLVREGALPPGLESVTRVVAVVAHPDDESFGLGGVLGLLVDHGIAVDVLCLSHGEASTLGAAEDLGEVRERELRHAAAVLGVDRVWLHGLPDGHLATHGERIAYLVDRAVAGRDRAEPGGPGRAPGTADAVVVFEPSGVTGHGDHVAATEAALGVARRRGLVSLEWGVPPAAARQLAAELAVPFSGLGGDDVVAVRVDRARQRAAVACHRSQATGNPVLERRLALQGDVDHVRVRLPAPRPPKDRTALFPGPAPG